MAGLANVQNQIDILKGNDEFQKKKVLEPENISDVRKFISANKGQKLGAEHEASFQEWEKLIANFNREKEMVTIATAQATANVGHTVIGANTTPVAVTNQPLDPIMGVVNQKDLEKELQNSLKSELKSLDGKLDTMSMEQLDSALSITEKIVGLQWIEKVPGTKEKTNEIMKYEPMIQGITGATLIEKLKSIGYSFYFTGTNQIKVASNQTDARDVETKLNAYLKGSSVLPKVIQSGLLYLNPSFSTFRESVLDNTGKIINPNLVNIKNYTEYLKKDPQKKLDSSEKIFLQSSGFYDPSIDFQKLLSQSKDLNQIATFVKNNPSFATQIQGAPLTNPVNNQTNTTPTTSPSTTAGKAAGAVGEGIGTVAGGIGSLIGAVASETGATWSTILSEATKTGGAMGAIGVIGLLIGSIWKFGFWKTMMGVVGVGGASAIANAAEDGTFDKLANKMKKGGDKLANAVGKISGDTSVVVAPASDVAAPAVKVASNIDKSQLSEYQKAGVLSIESNKSLLEDIVNYSKQAGKDKQNADLNTYINTLHKDSIQNITLDKLIYTADHEQSIFSDTVKSQFGDNKDIPDTVSRYLLKKTIRSYIGINTSLSMPTNNQKEGQQSLDDFKKKFPENQWKNKTLKDLLNEVYKK